MGTSLFTGDGTVRLRSFEEYSLDTGVFPRAVYPVRRDVYDPWPLYLNSPDVILLPDGEVNLTVYLPMELSCVAGIKAHKSRPRQNMMEFMLTAMAAYTSQPQQPFPFRESLLDLNETLVVVKTKNGPITTTNVVAHKVLASKGVVDSIDRIARQREQPRYQTLFEIAAAAVGVQGQ